MSRDLRHYARQTTTRLIFGALILIFVVGDGLIYWRYGKDAAVTGLLCFGAALLPILMVIVILWLLEKVVKNANRK
ncbi:MAG: hypothetical protein ABFD44_02225 [Anaerolineaceae bacterium]